MALYLKCELHTRQKACDSPLSLRLIEVRSATHACIYFDAYFFIERIGKAGFVHGFAGAISICVVVSYDGGHGYIV